MSGRLRIQIKDLKPTEKTSMGNVSLDGKDYPCLGGLNQYILNCEKAICSVKARFEYPQMKAQCWREKDIDNRFRPELKRMKGYGNVYAIFEFRKGDCSNCNIVYIGTSRKYDLDGRIKEHLVKAADTTYSKLECVKFSVWRGFNIAISYILVEPDNLRFFVEQELIEKLDPPWNKRRG